MSGCVSVYAVKQTPSVSSGIEEVVDCVEEEDEEAEEGQQGIGVKGISEKKVVVRLFSSFS